MKRYKHNLSHQRLLTCDMGQLVPISTVEVLPGDTVQHNTNCLIRVSPLAAPVMHQVSARIHHFFVPNRILWEGWEDFITGGPDGNNAATVPQVTMSIDPETGPLPDYMGVPFINNLKINALPIYAFNAIYNEFYRDQDLANSRTPADMTIPQIAWEKDYFTTCRPWTQKGPDVTVPLGESAPVLSNPAPDNRPQYKVSTGAGTPFFSGSGGSVGLVGHGGGGGEGESFEWHDPNLYADLSAAVGGDINDIRKAFAIQRYQEARARYGSRYTEYLRYLGVTPKDSRLQRPEFLGGGTTQLNFSEIMQTAPDDSGDPRFGVADLYGHGIAAMRSNRYRRHIEEHGWVISLLSVRPKSVYNQSVHRQWLRTDKEDYFQKELAQVGQQEVWDQELFAEPVEPENRTIFGYQDRYAEYREVPSGVSAEFRDKLDYWHMARNFAGTPTLNQTFTDCVPTKRIHNEQSQHALWITAQHKMVARRIVPRNAAPRIL